MHDANIIIAVRALRVPVPGLGSGVTGPRASSSARSQVAILSACAGDHAGPSCAPLLSSVAAPGSKPPLTARSLTRVSYALDRPSGPRNMLVALSSGPTWH